MKKLLMSLALAAGLLIPTLATAQVTSIVADGTETNGYVPVYGLWMDDYTRTQMIYPATMLDELTPGSEISSLTFFANETSYDWGTAAFEVRLGEVSETTLSSFLTYTSTTVYTGAVTVSNSQMVVTFTTPYTYMGENLMVEFYQTATGSWHTVNFYGVSATGASGYGYNSSSAGSASFSQGDFLPKMEIEYTSGGDISCYKVKNLAATDITSDEITLTWLDTSNSNATYSIAYWTTGGDTNYTTSTTTSVTVTDLNANTQYYFAVTPNCTDGSTANATTGNWRTACGNLAIPYNEDFEGFTTMAAPTCWTAISGMVYVRSSSYTSHNGEKYLDFRGFSAGDTNNAIALPLMEQPTNELQVHFWTRPESFTSDNCGSFGVGYMTDLTVDSTYVELVNWSYNSFSAYEEKEVPMIGAPDNAYIVLRQHSNAYNYYWYVDDLVVEPIPACPHPTAVSASNVTSDGADITITGIEGASYRIYWTDGTDADSTDVTTDTYTFTGLNATTTYTVTVATLCDDGSVTATVSTSFRTLCEDGGCDLVINMTDSYGDGWNGNAINVFSGNETVGQATLSSGSSGTYTYSLCGSEHIVLTWTLGSYAYETSFEVTVGGELMASMGGSSLSDGDTILDVTGCPTCPSPSNLHFSNITTDGADISWTAGGTETEWAVFVNGQWESASDTTYTVSSLEPNTLYNVIVRAVCDGNDSSYAISGSFRTACGLMQAPYVTGFEDDEDGEIPSCWVQVAAGTSGSGTFPSVYNYAYNARTGNVYFKFESSNGETEIAALPQIENISTLALSFYASLTNNNLVLEAGVMEDTTFVLVDTVNLVAGTSFSTGYQLYTVYYSNYSGSGERMALRVTGAGSYTLMIDDLSVEEFSGCYPVSDLTASDIDSVSITLSWTDELNSGATYNVSYWMAGGDTTVMNVSDVTATISGLSGNTQYYFSVVTDCGSGSSPAITGDWRTACGNTAIPFTEGFEGLPTNAAPSCWTVLGGNPTVRSNTSYSTIAYSGNQYLDFRGANTNAIALPPMAQPTGELQVRFWTRPENFTSSSCGSFSVGYMTDLTVDSTFVELANWSYDSFTAYEEKEVPMVGAPDTAFIVLRHNANSTYYYWYVDDLVVEPIPSCTHPVSVSASNVTATDADITIVGVDGSSYRLWWSDGTTTDSIDLTTDTYSFTNLSGSTEYTIAVATICEDGSITSTVGTTFRTDCAAGSCDVVIEMEDSYGDGWNGNAVNGFIAGSQVFSATFANGFSETYTYSLCSTDTLELRWYTGNYAYETSFTITAGGDMIASGSGSDYSDGEVIGTTSGCPTCPSPATPVVTTVTENEIGISFDGSPSGNYVLVITDGQTYTDTVNVTGDTTHTFTNLTSTTTYQISVFSDCGNGEISNPRNLTVNTTAVASALPYSTGFETGDDTGWMLVNGTQTNQWVIDTAASNTGSHALYISNDNGVSNAYDISSASSVYATKLLAFDSIGDYVINYDWSGNGESSFDYLRVFLVPSTVDLVAGNANGISSTGTPTDWIALDGGSKLNLSSTWQNHNEVFTVTNPGNYQVVFFWHNDLSVGTNPPAAVDNVQVGRLSCPAPQNIEFDDINGSTATFHWTPAGSESEWEVTFDGVSTIVNTPDYTVSGLSAMSGYTVSVRAVCGDGDTSFATSINFATPCATVTDFPWIEDFENESTFMCWSQTGDSEWEHGTGDNNTSTGAHSGSYNALITHNYEDDVTMLISPVLALSGDNAMLSFWHLQRVWSGDQDELRVYYRTSESDNWNLLATYTNDIQTWTKDSVVLPNLSATYQIGFEMTDQYGHGVAIDDIMVTGEGGGISVCAAPTITSTTATETTATVTFESDAALKQVAIVTGNVNAAAFANATAIDVTGNTHTFNGLTPGAAYTIGVRAVCSDDNISEWTLSHVTTDDHPCLMPTDVTVSGLSLDGATISWTPAESTQTNFEVRVYNNTFDQTYTVQGNTLTVTNLFANVTYYVEVRAVCGEGFYSDWTAAVDFTTADCMAPSNVNATADGRNVTVSWQSTGADRYRVVYFDEFTPADDATTVEVENGATTVTVTVPEGGRMYNFYVFAYCGDALSTPSDVAEVEILSIGTVSISEVTLYPNPASTTVTVSGIEGESTVTVVDMNGRTVYTNTTNSDLTIDLTGMAKGAYFVRITGEQATAVRKLIVK